MELHDGRVHDLDPADRDFDGSFAEIHYRGDLDFRIRRALAASPQLLAGEKLK